MGLALPDPADWDIPIRCFRCEGEYAVPAMYFKAGTVFYCPHCQGSLVPTLSMVRAVDDAIAQFHARWTDAFDAFRDKRQRELEQFEEKQRRELEDFTARLRTVALREKAPGAPAKRRGFFAL